VSSSTPAAHPDYRQVDISLRHVVQRRDLWKGHQECVPRAPEAGCWITNTKLLLARFRPTAGGQTKFFVSADTVATINYQGHDEAHAGWGFDFRLSQWATEPRSCLHASHVGQMRCCSQQALASLGST